MSETDSSFVQDDHSLLRHNEKQTVNPVAGTVVYGKIPQWLEGSLIRNGPGIHKIGKYQYNHLFDGLAILHKFSIKNGQAFYQSRALESETYKRNFAANRIVVSEFGTVSYPDPCQSIFGWMQSKFSAVFGKQDGVEMSDNCLVNVAYYGDQLYAVAEGVFIRRIDPETLKSVGDKTRIKDYCVLNTATAHPHCLEDGTVLNIGINYRGKLGPHYCFVKVPPSFDSDETAYKDAKLIAQIPSRWKFNPGYFHSFAMTQDKIIFLEMPLCVDIISILKAPLFGKPYMDSVKWHSSQKTRFHVIGMENGQPHSLTYETDNLFTFHHINAYEENGFLIVDLCGYNNGDFIKNPVSKSLDTAVPKCTARRYILPLETNEAKPGENLVDIPNTTATAILRPGKRGIIDLTPHHFSNDWFELPRINYKFNGKKYNFVYGIGGSDDPNPDFAVANKIIKIDVEKGTKTEYFTGEDMTPSEPVFISDPTKTNPDEDNGVILSILLHKSIPKDVTLLILNAKDMTEICKVRFTAEGAVTYTLHGLWTPTEQDIKDNKATYSLPELA